MVDYYKASGTTIISGNSVSGTEFTEKHYKLSANLDSGSKAAVGNHGAHGQSGSSSIAGAGSNGFVTYTTNHVESDALFKSRSQITSSVASVLVDLDLDYTCHHIRLRNVLTTNAGGHKVWMRFGYQSNSSPYSLNTHTAILRASNTTGFQGVTHRRSSSLTGCHFPNDNLHDDQDNLISGVKWGVCVDLKIFTSSWPGLAEPSGDRGSITGIAKFWGTTGSYLIQEDSFITCRSSGTTAANDINRLFFSCANGANLNGGQIEYYADEGMPRV